VVGQPLVIGRYEVRAELGTGGFATVYRAYDPALDREVALKVLHAHLAGDPLIRERFLREGRALARVRHPNIVHVYDAGEAGALAYLAMELVEGRPLDAILRERGPLPLAEVLTITDQIAGALAAVHARQLVHRDVKPTNILIEHGTGRAVLLDLGVARDLASPTITTTVIVGTPTFMAPEQVTGGQVTPRTDVYQLGATVYTLLTGRPPFLGEPFQVMDAIVRAAPPDLGALRPDLPPAVVATVAEAMAKDPARRPPDARAFAAALRAGAEEAPTPVASDIRVPRQGIEPTPGVGLDEVATQRVSPRTPPAAGPVAPARSRARGRALPLALIGGGAAAALLLGALAVAGRGGEGGQARAVTATPIATTAASAALTPTPTAAPSPTAPPTPRAPVTPTSPPPTPTLSPTPRPTPPPTPTPPPPTPTRPPAPGTPAPNPVVALAATMRRAGYVPDGPIVVVPVSTGGAMYVQKGICAGSATGRCQIVFIYLNERFLGTDTLNPSAAILEIRALGVDRFGVLYANYAPDDPGCCPSLPPVGIVYTWTGTRLVPSGVPPGH
jgi:serine/threonine-protein kinase